MGNLAITAMAQSAASILGGSSQVKRVGVIGGGQLAWMMAAGAQKLGLELYIQTPSADDPACAIASSVFLGAVDDAAVTAAMAAQCDVITFENEFVDLAALRKLEQQGAAFYPQLNALTSLLDKYEQRQYCEAIGLPSLPFTTLEGECDRSLLKEKIEKIGLPLVLKTRRHGYDGQGTFVLRSLAEVEQTWLRLSYQPILLEAFVAFEKELAVMVARSLSGEVAVYPVVETVQVDQVCRRVIAPARVDQAVLQQVQHLATALINHLGAVGVFGIELFLTRTGSILVNEIAPRAHNSGHYTLNACQTSQFEQQLRALSDRPLGSVALTVPKAVMVNLLGTEDSAHNDCDCMEKRQAIANIPNAIVHWYGKKQSRIGRKMGHATALLDHQSHDDAIDQIIHQIEKIWYG